MTTRAVGAASSWRRMAGIVRGRTLEAGLALALAVLFVVLSLTAPHFLTPDNLLNVLHDAAFQGIVAWGMTLVIVGGEIDISVGPAVAFASVLLATLTSTLGWPLPLAIPAVLAEGAAVGLLAGIVRVRWNVPSFIVTLALWSAFRGLALLITNALPITITNDRFQFWGNGSVGRIPVPAIVMFLLFFVMWFVAERTRFGRWVYAVGGNPDAARLAGIRVGRVRTLLLGLTGVLAAFTGVLLASWLGSGNPSAADGLEFDVIAAVIIGGTDLYGGRGSMVGTLMGVLFIGLIANGLVLLGVNPYAQGVVRGGIILTAVLLNMTLRKKRR